jgi:large subunit ribosomal protein L49
MFQVGFKVFQRRIETIMLASVRNRHVVNGRRKNSAPVIHQSQQPHASATIDFTTLGLKFELTNKLEFTIPRVGWAPKPPVEPKLPFIIDRSALGYLPVYTEYKNGRTKVFTILRKCKGDIELLKEDLEKVVGKPVKIQFGKLVVEGNYTQRIKIWLVGLGF